MKSVLRSLCANKKHFGESGHIDIHMYVFVQVIIMRVEHSSIEVRTCNCDAE